MATWFYFRLSSWRTLAGGPAGTGGDNSAGVAGGVDDDGGAASVDPSPTQSGTGTNTASVGCTEGGGGRLVGVENPSFCCSSCGSEFVSWGDVLLVGGNTALVARPYRPYDWCEWVRGSPIVTDGGTNFRKKCMLSTKDARNHLSSPSIGRSSPMGCCT